MKVDGKLLFQATFYYYLFLLGHLWRHYFSNQIFEQPLTNHHFFRFLIFVCKVQKLWSIFFECVKMDFEAFFTVYIKRILVQFSLSILLLLFYFFFSIFYSLNNYFFLYRSNRVGVYHHYTVRVQIADSRTYPEKWDSCKHNK